jgi:hypothetical protein
LDLAVAAGPKGRALRERGTRRSWQDNFDQGVSGNTTAAQ